MDNFVIQNCVDRLIQSFGLHKSDVDVINLVDRFQQSISSPRSLQFQTAFSNVLQTLKDKSRDGPGFVTKYEALKSHCPPLVTKLLMIFFGKLLEEKKQETPLNLTAASSISTPASMAVRGYEDLFQSHSLSHHGGMFDAPFTGEMLKQKNISRKNFPADSNMPKIDLCQTRPFMKNCFVKSNVDGHFENINVDSKNVTEQEEILVEDLLFVMQGIEGNFIKISSASGDTEMPLASDVRFSINASFDVSLRTLASRILPVCADYHAVTFFLDKFFVYDFGMVSQAFCAAVRHVVEEYLTVVCQLELQQKTGQLSIQKLWFYVQPVQRSMKLLAAVCSAIDTTDSCGGVILTLLHSTINDLIGDKVAQDLCSYLLHASSKPFLIMLERWLYSGQIYDPFHEFMITEHGSAQRHMSGASFDEIDDWERRYTFKRDLCPDYLYSVSDKILNCGKYLNIMSSCGCKMDANLPRSLADTNDERLFLLTIEEAHNLASQRLVRMLVNRFSLLDRFQFAKHYFLLDQSDWLMNFLELAEEELHLCIDDIRPHRLESFLDIALRTSSMALDRFRDDIKIELTPSTLTSFLLHVIEIHGDVQDSATKLPFEPTSGVRAVDAFSVRYDAEWPLSIIFNRKIMTQYQIIFRRLLICKYVERSLSRCWIAKRRKSYENLLLHSMMTFLKNYMYYITAEVIEPNWHKFWTFVESGTKGNLAIDDVLREHSNLLDNCTKDCLLTESCLVEIVDKILKLCLQFASDSFADINVLKSDFSVCRAELSAGMQTLSNSQREKSWVDIAYRLDLQL